MGAPRAVVMNRARGQFLAVPVSPVMSTVLEVAATVSSSWKSVRMAGLCPTIPLIRYRS